MSPASCSITLKFWRTASAVPRYHSATRPRAMYGWRSFTPPLFRSRSHGRPRPMWSFSDRGLYWVRTTTSSMPRVDAVREREVDDPVLAAERHRGLGADPGEDRQALALTAGEDHRHRPLHAADASSRRPGATGDRCSERSVARRVADWAAAERGLDEQPRVHEVAVELDHPVEVAARRVAGVALVADDLARLSPTAGVDPPG